MKRERSAYVTREGEQVRVTREPTADEVREVRAEARRDAADQKARRKADLALLEATGSTHELLMLRSVPDRIYMDPFVQHVEIGVAGADEQANAPVWITYDLDREWWVFREKVYTTTEDLDANAVRALILQAERKKEARVSRAIAAARADSDPEVFPRVPIPDEVKVRVWQRDGGRCVRCGSNRALEFDHIIPVSMGGASSFRNVQLLCEACNREKGDNLA